MATYKEVFELAASKGYNIQFGGQIDKDFTWYLEIETTLIQKWLRDEHKLHIYIDTTPSFDNTQPSKYKASVKVPFSPFRWTTGHYYLGDTYEEALLKGINEALKLIQ